MIAGFFRHYWPTLVACLLVTLAYEAVIRRPHRAVDRQAVAALQDNHVLIVRLDSALIATVRDRDLWIARTFWAESVAVAHGAVLLDGDNP